LNEKKDSGRFEVYWDGTNNSGNPAASGIYFYRLTTGKFVKIGKMILIR